MRLKRSTKCTNYTNYTKQMRLMFKVPDSREDHRETMLIRCGNHLRVAHRSAGLNHSGNAMPGSFINAIAKREEGIGREY